MLFRFRSSFVQISTIFGIVDRALVRDENHPLSRIGQIFGRFDTTFDPARITVSRGLRNRFALPSR